MIRTQMRRSGMDRGCGCGLRQYRGEAAADIALGRLAVIALTGPAPEPVRKQPCPLRSGVWHLVPVAARIEAFPPAVAALIDARDRWCVLCGSPRRLHHHHRRIRGMGGDPCPHADCACNGVLLCARDHARIHDTAEGREMAGRDGLIIPRSTIFPGSAGVLIHTADGGMQKWLACDGRYHDEPIGAAA